MGGDYLYRRVGSKRRPQLPIMLTHDLEEREKQFQILAFLEINQRFATSNSLIKPFVHIFCCSIWTNKWAREGLVTQGTKVAQGTLIYYVWVLSFLLHNFWDVQNWYAATSCSTLFVKEIKTINIKKIQTKRQYFSVLIYTYSWIPRSSI